MRLSREEERGAALSGGVTSVSFRRVIHFFSLTFSHLDLVNDHQCAGLVTQLAYGREELRSSRHHSPLSLRPMPRQRHHIFTTRAHGALFRFQQNQAISSRGASAEQIIASRKTKAVVASHGRLSLADQKPN